MTLTATDLFCGAGGSSLGAEWAGLELVMAANHWQTAVDVHQAHFPNAGHDVADISQADPRRYPRTDVLLASPECTNHSQARGVSRKRQDPSLWDANYSTLLVLQAAQNEAAARRAGLLVLPGDPDFDELGLTP